MRVGLSLIFLALPLAAADWIRLRTPEIELLTDAGERAGRDTLARMNQVRGFFSDNAQGPLNLRIYLFSSEREFRDYTDVSSTDGFYQSGPERDYIVLHSGVKPGRVVVHEYIHLLLNHGTAPLPSWFEEGMAEFYSTLEPRGSRVALGIPIEEHRQTLSRERWMDAAELMQTLAKSPVIDERSRAGIFYAQSWALVHMLNLGPRYRMGMPRFVALLAEGVDTPECFSQAFGKTPEQAISDLKSYISRAGPAVVEGATAVPQRAAAAAERMPEVEAALARAELALRTGHREPARKLFEQAAREHPDSPDAEAGLGMLAMYDGDRMAARKHLERALTLGARDANTWFEYAMFERESGADRARVDELLRKAVELNPGLGEAQFTLGVRLTDDGRYEDAVAHLGRAVRALPRQSPFWHALAFALDKLGRRPEALDAARRAVRSASSPEEERMADALFQSLQ
jgi:tetratricopeptide (TPR) repeat protein